MRDPIRILVKNDELTLEGRQPAATPAEQPAAASRLAVMQAERPVVQSDAQAMQPAVQ